MGTAGSAVHLIYRRQEIPRPGCANVSYSGNTGRSKAKSDGIASGSSWPIAFIKRWSGVESSRWPSKRTVTEESEIESIHTRKRWRNKGKLTSPGYEETGSGSIFFLEFNLDGFADLSVSRRNKVFSGEESDVVADG